MISPEADEYLASALDLMEGNALHRDNINWGAVRAEASRRGTGASAPAETYDAIRWALSQLQDDHSFFAAPDRGFTAIASGQYEREATMPNGYLRSDRIAYLNVPAFRGSPQLVTQYADCLQEFIALFDDSDPIGWIVDLTDNGGGNMWPMLAGLGPLLSAGPLGSFRFPTQPPATWSYSGGRAYLDDVSFANATTEGYSLRHAEKPNEICERRLTKCTGHWARKVPAAGVGRWPSLPCVGRMAAFSRRPSSPAVADGPAGLHLSLFGDFQRVVDLDSEVSDGAFKFRVAE
jgi:hypothetical protein